MTNLNYSGATTSFSAVNQQNATVTSGQQESTMMDSGEVSRLLWVWWSPLTFTLGLIGNSLVIMIFGFANKAVGMTTTTSTTSIYFTVMAVADLSFLFFGIIPEWLEACGYVVIKNLHYSTCKLEKFLFYVSGDVAIWIICITSMDRFVAVCFPFTQQTFRKAKYAKIASAATLALAVAKNLHVFWTRGPEYDSYGELIKVCGRPEPYTNFEYYIRPWIAFVLVALLPFVMVLLFNIFIVRFFIKEQNRKRTTGKKHQPDFTQTIMMCIAISMAFLILVTPSLILYIGKPYWSSGGKNYVYDVTKAVANQLSYVNHSINFLLYCLTARKFREEAYKLMVPKICLKLCRICRNRSQKTWRNSIVRTLSLKKSKQGFTASQNDVTVNFSSSENLVHAGKCIINLKEIQDTFREEGGACTRVSNVNDILEKVNNGETGCVGNNKTDSGDNTSVVENGGSHVRY